MEVDGEVLKASARALGREVSVERSQVSRVIPVKWGYRKGILFDIPNNRTNRTVIVWDGWKHLGNLEDLNWPVDLSRVEKVTLGYMGLKFDGRSDEMKMASKER